jgi:hypothetical protein
MNRPSRRSPHVQAEHPAPLPEPAAEPAEEPPVAPSGRISLHWRVVLWVWTVGFVFLLAFELIGFVWRITRHWF